MRIIIATNKNEKNRSGQFSEVLKSRTNELFLRRAAAASARCALHGSLNLIHIILLFVVILGQRAARRAAWLGLGRDRLGWRRG